MSGFTNLDVMAVHRFDIDSRTIELEKALEGAYLDSPVRGVRRYIRDGARSRADLDWSRYLILNRCTA